MANRNDGIVTRVDFQGGGSSQQNIYSGGSRGDFAAVDSHGCLYITQSSTIVRISSANGSCAFEPTTPGVTLVPLTGSHTPTACKRMQSLTIRLRTTKRSPYRVQMYFNGKRIKTLNGRLRRVVIYINGKRVKSVGGRALSRTIRLTRLPHKAFHLKMVVVMKSGHKKVRRRFYANCQRA